MANYTILPNSAVNTGGLPSGTTVTALRDNPIAITEGALNAPRIVGAAIKLVADMPVLTVSASDDVNATILCDVVDGTQSTSSTTFQLAQTITVVKGTGSMRFRAGCNQGSAVDGEMEVTKNGVFVATFDAGTNNTDNQFADISVVPGDIIRWFIKREGATVANVTFLNRGVFATDSYVPRLPYVPHLLRNVS